MPTVEFDFNDSDSGYIQSSGFFYSVGTGYANVLVSYNSGTGARRRSIMRFDTSSLGAGAIITKVEIFNQFALSSPANPPSAGNVLIGSWCGASLNATANDYNASGAINLGFDMAAAPDATWIDLAVYSSLDPIPGINKTGITDLMYQDNSIGGLNTGKNWNTAKSKCKMRITLAGDLKTRCLLGAGV